MSKKKKKSKVPKVDWKQLSIQAAIDFLIGLLLLMVDRIMK